MLSPRLYSVSSERDERLHDVVQLLVGDLESPLPLTVMFREPGQQFQ